MYNISFESEIEDEEKASILIVDDEELILQSLQMILERYFNVIKLSDPLKVFDVLKNNTIDILISDEMMPGMRGCELAEKVHNEYPNICKIILSGNSDKKDIVTAINKGHIYSFLFKPVDVNQLLQAVKQGLDNKRMKEMIEEQNKNLEEKNRKLLEEVLKKSTKIIEMEKFYELGKFSASIVHDLNSPLQTLITGYQLLEDEIHNSGNSNDSSENILKLIDSSLTTMENMIKSISNRINNNLSEKPVDFDLNELIRKNINYMQLKYNNISSVDVTFIPGEEVPKMKGIPLHFDQIITNLFKNSYDAMENSNQKKIVVKTFVKADNICLYLLDTGCGIKAEELDMIFNVGFSTKEHGKGTGLGLVITKQMVNSYKGKIKVESKFGEGTSFLICFPMKK
ncbi:MAG TPA: hybrid sensor histidine kinase/response regulator [Clostridiales bacterium]|nr:hybrid sensor histidine kinase/response regulator [Clostridiales bacterium]HQP70366.1 hybrid sensor histidine kinase/response regulator [Clostridiales bacterium]